MADQVRPGQALEAWRAEVERLRGHILLSPVAAALVHMAEQVFEELRTTVQVTPGTTYDVVMTIPEGPPVTVDAGTTIELNSEDAAAGVPPCPAGEPFITVVYSKGGGAYGEHHGQRCQHGQRPPEISFPVISTHDKALLVQFTTFEDRTAFKAWLISPGWQEFLDSRRR